MQTLPAIIQSPTIAAQIIAARAVAFTGSRQPAPESTQVCKMTCAIARATNARVLIGDAQGIDRVVNQETDTPQIFYTAAPYKAGQLAARSLAMLRAARQANALVLSFPSHACPATVAPRANPSACFNGSGSGTWSTTAAAVGCGLRVLVYLPAGVSAPSWLQEVAPQWYSNAATQSSLF